MVLKPDNRHQYELPRSNSQDQTGPYISVWCGEQHWHGLHVPGDVDGGLDQEIVHGALWSPDVPIVQNASLNWFHSHVHGKTAQQTYQGLAGVLLVEDGSNLSSDLPMSYGFDDFTLVLQDKTFDANGGMSYELTGEVFKDGFEGDTVVVGGVIAPVVRAVPTGLVRLRIVNVRNASVLELSMEVESLIMIASAGGFLLASVETKRIFMSPGERYEVLVDMSLVETNALPLRLNGDGGCFAGLFGAK